MKQKILLTFIESGFGHISSMESIYQALADDYSEYYDIQKSYIMHEDGFPALCWMENFFCKQVENTNKIPGFGKFIFGIIDFLGGQHIMRFYHRQLARKSFRDIMEAFRRRSPDIIVTNHYFTNLMAVEYKRRIDPNVVVINYNPDNTLHSFWDKRDGIFIVNNKHALDKAIKYGFKRDNLRQVTPCVREVVEKNTKTRAELRREFELPQDKFTVVVADGGYMAGRGPKFAKELIRRKLPITLCIIAGKNQKRYEEFMSIAEGRSKLKVDPQMTLKVYGFLPNAYELYGAADLFLTKGGPNAVLDSVYMNTPVMIDHTPHVIEEMTARYFVDELGCGECAFTPGKAAKRIMELAKDPKKLGEYRSNIKKLIEKGNGATGVADIIHAEATYQRAVYAESGKLFDCDIGVWKSAGQHVAEEKIESADVVPEPIAARGDEQIDARPE